MKVSIIILNYKQKELTVNCVKSVLSQNYKDFEIILVDNASKDGSVESLRKEFGHNPKIKIIESRENTGYTGGNNLGYKYAKGKYIAVLNNDTIVDKKWLVELITALESKKNIAMATSQCLNTPSFDNLYKKIKIIQKKPLWTTTILGYPSNRKIKSKEPVSTFAVHGGSFIYKKNIVGVPFDPDYFIYAEETKLSWLTRLRGYEIVIAPKSYFFHLGNVVRKKDFKINKYFTFLGERNKIINFLTFYSIKNLIKLSPLILLGTIFINFSELRKIPYRFKSYLWILFHLGWISKKRREAQKKRRVKDDDIIKNMSCKFYDDYFFSGVAKYLFKILNFLFCIYCRIMLIKTIEYYEKNT